jgi:hypothetical protein
MAKDPLPAPVVDLRREMTTLKAAQAAVIFFEVASTFGVRNGVANMTLEGGSHLTFDGKVIDESRVMAQLRFPVAAIPSIRGALDRIEKMLEPVPEELKN